MFYVYILYSESGDRYYIGQTNNLALRLKQHNGGNSKYTSVWRPWKLVWKGRKDNRSEAMLLEKKLKNLSKERLMMFIEKYS